MSAVLLCVEDRVPDMNWKNLIAILLLLLLPMSWWLTDLLLPHGTIQFAMHMAKKGEHCYDHCSHPVSLIDEPQETDSAEALWVVCLPEGKLLARRLHPHAVRDHPPPLFYSLSHSLHAPPTLILA